MCNDTHSLASGDSRARTVASSTWLSRPPRIKDATGLSESFQLGTCEAPSMPSGTIVAVRPREHHEHHQQCVDHSPTGDGVWVQSGLQTTTSMHLPMVMRHTSSHNFRKASDQPSVELSAQAAPPPPVQYGCNSMGNGFKHYQY